MEWTIEISPSRRWRQIDLRELWQYRDLLRMYVRRDVVVVYKQSILGPLWYLIQPALTTIMFMFVFGGLAGISTDGVPQALFYLCGLLLWNYFSAVFTEVSGVFLKYSYMFGKVYFPRLIVPLSTATSNLLKLGIQAMLFVAVYAYLAATGQAAEVHITPDVFMIPVYVLIVGIISLSWGMIVSSLTTKYRDLQMLVNFGVQLYMYATPVIYPVSVAPERYRDLLMLNPLTPLIEGMRHALLGCGQFPSYWILYSAAVAIVSLFAALVIFAKVERTFVDTV